MDFETESSVPGIASLHINGGAALYSVSRDTIAFAIFAVGDACNLAKMSHGM